MSTARSVTEIGLFARCAKPFRITVRSNVICLACLSTLNQQCRQPKQQIRKRMSVLAMRFLPTLGQNLNGSSNVICENPNGHCVTAAPGDRGLDLLQCQQHRCSILLSRPNEYAAILATGQRQSEHPLWHTCRPATHA